MNAALRRGACPSKSGGGAIRPTSWSCPHPRTFPVSHPPLKPTAVKSRLPFCPPPCWSGSVRPWAKLEPAERCPQWSGTERQPPPWTDELAEMSRHIYTRHGIGEALQKPVCQVGGGEKSILTVSSCRIKVVYSTVMSAPCQHIFDFFFFFASVHSFLMRIRGVISQPEVLQFNGEKSHLLEKKWSWALNYLASCNGTLDACAGPSSFLNKNRLFVCRIWSTRTLIEDFNEKEAHFISPTE